MEPSAQSHHPIRIVLVDDQALFRSGLSLVLSAQPDFEIIGEAGNGAQAIDVVRRLEPDIVLMDVRMPVMDGVEATRQILSQGLLKTKIILLTTFNLDEASAAAIRYGASGFILKDASPDFLAQSIRTVHSGNSVIAPVELHKLFGSLSTRAEPEPPPEKFNRLTERERGMFTLIAQGLSNQEISSAEFLSEATVKTHVSNILNKLELRDRVQLVVFAHTHNILEL